MSGGAAPAAPEAWNAPDKYLVKNGDEVDWQATAKKIDEGRSHLEKRMGSGDVPPADVSGYKIEVPADYAEVLAGWDPAADESLKGFLEKGHKLGMTQGVADLVVAEYGRVMASMKGQQLTPEQQAAAAEDAAAKALGEVWKDQGEFDKNVGLAYQAGVKMAAKLGVDYAEFDTALGNNPMFLRLAAALAPEMGEDTPQGTDQQPGDSLDWDAKRAELVAQRDALPASDPRRAQVVKQISDHYSKRYKG